MGEKSRSNFNPGRNMSKSLEKSLKDQHNDGTLAPMLTRDHNRRNIGVPRKGSKSQILKLSSDTYPIEVREKFGELTLFTASGYIYARVKNKAHSLARIVYSIHNPDYKYTSNQKVYHIDNDPLNNRIENLTLSREEARGV